MAYFLKDISRFNTYEFVSLLKNMKPITYVPVLSDPSLVDTDGDCINDNNDNEPLIENLYNYFIYYVRPDGSTENSMEEPAFWMAEYAYDDENCILYEISTSEEFQRVWNELIPAKAANIHIYLHGQPGQFSFRNDDIVTNWDIESKKYILKNKTVSNKVYLYSCNGGTIKSGAYLECNLSMAESIAKICPNTKVEALQDDEVDYYNLIHSTPKEYISSIFRGTFFMTLGTEFFINIYDHEYVFFPLMHERNGRWLYVTYSTQTKEYTIEIIGDKWEI